jgi:putative membrane protein
MDDASGRGDLAEEGPRERLALERTRLANERTVLAYVRTALALLASGVSFLEFYRSPGLDVAGWAAIVLGLLLLGVGTARFLRARRRLSSLAQPSRREGPRG